MNLVGKQIIKRAVKFLAVKVYCVTSKAICVHVARSSDWNLTFEKKNKFYSTRLCVAKLPNNICTYGVISGRSLALSLFSTLLGYSPARLVLVCRIVKSTDESKWSEMMKTRRLLKNPPQKKSFKSQARKIQTKIKSIETLNKLSLDPRCAT